MTRTGAHLCFLSCIGFIQNFMATGRTKLTPTNLSGKTRQNTLHIESMYM